MKGKAALVVGLATGYVLGARDGRERYEQIKSKATQVANDPRVQEKATQASDLAKEKAPLVKDKVTEATSKAASSTSHATGSVTGAVSARLPGRSKKSEPLDAAGPFDTVDALDDEVVVVTTPSSTGSLAGGTDV